MPDGENVSLLDVVKIDPLDICLQSFKLATIRLFGYLSIFYFFLHLFI